MTTLRTDTTHSGITIDYANGSGFVHGGSGLLSVYSDDEKAAINALTDANDDTYYLFLVKNVTELDADGNNTVVSGYMPVGYQHGFIFEQFDVARTIAHELSHGAFALHHTFSANTESFHANEGTTNNLMDYAEGATLNYKQWSWMHEKHGKGLFGFLADEEDGESQITSDPICTQKFIEAFRYAYANNKTLTYEKDGWPYAGHFAKDLKLLDDVTYKKLYVSVLQDLGTKVSDRRITPKKQNGQSVYTLGSVLTIATNDNFDKFDNYLYPDNTEWNQQMNGFVKQISALSERSKILESLSILPAPLCEWLDFQTRAKFLKTISNGMVMEGYTGCVNDEEALINLVGNVPNDQIKNLFDELSKNNLMQTLRSGIDNFGGDDNYTNFIYALTETYFTAHGDVLSEAINAYENNDKNLKYQVFVWNKQFDDRRRVKYKQEYKNNKIVIETWIGHRLSEDTHVHTRTVDPFEPIILSCHTASEKMGIKENTALPMPGFMLEWFLNEKDNENIVKAIDLVTTFVSFGLAAKAISKAQKFVEIADMFFATGNLALQNGVIEEYFKSINEKTKNENGQGILDYWNTLSNLWNYSKPVRVLILNESIKAFDSFVILWNEYKKSPDFQTCPENIKSTINQLIDDFKIIEDEEEK